MIRTQWIFVGMCAVVLALGPAAAWAQPMPENNPQACHDGFDNDGNGYVDCQDPGCAPFCQAPPPGYAQPPPPGYAQPGYAPPPPGYYQQPPPQYVQPVYVVQRPPRNGLGQIIAGAILLPLGVIFIAASAVLWENSCAVLNGGCPIGWDPNGWAAAWLDIVGIPFVIAGLILIPVGAARYARYKDWKRAHGMALLEKGNLKLEPVIGHSALMSGGGAGLGSSLASSGTFGLKLSW